MSRGTILAHKHTLCEAFTGFFRALATERFSEVLRNLKLGLGSATQRVRLGASQAEGARQIRTELLAPTGQQAGTVRFVLSPDGWRIYSLEVFTNSGRRPTPPPQPPVQIAKAPVPQEKRKSSSKLPKMSPKKWFATIYASR